MPKGVTLVLENLTSYFLGLKINSAHYIFEQNVTHLNIFDCAQKRSKFKREIDGQTDLVLHHVVPVTNCKIFFNHYLKTRFIFSCQIITKVTTSNMHVIVYYLL